MPIRRLDERHKTVAAELLRGTRRRDIAEKVGVDISTLYNWMKDDLFKAYMAKLSEDLEAAREQRLLPIVFLAAEAVEAAFSNALEDVQKRTEGAPAITTLVDCMKKVTDMERVGRGKPSDIKGTQTNPDATPSKLSPRSRKLVDSLDKWAEAEDLAEEAGTLASGSEVAQ